MGIPSYFSLIIKEYPEIIKKLIHHQFQIDNFFIDSNSIVYDCARSIDFSLFPNEDTHDVVIKHVIKKIEEYMSIVKPVHLLMISLDGTPPVAKLEQQRQRRYKSWFTSVTLKDMEISSQRKNTEDVHMNTSTTETSPFNTIEITTGTLFMKKLNKALIQHFGDASKFGLQKTIVSTSDDAGEGESKIYETIRSDPDVTKDSTCLIYGLDADLIMLSLNNLAHCPEIYLFRETPEFIKSVDSSLEPNENYVLNIPVLATKIKTYMEISSKSNPRASVDRTQDYIFICFMLGNDFLPHFPAVNIRTDGLDKLLAAYRSTLGDSSETIIQNNTISWKHLRNMLSKLAVREEEFISTELKKRDKFEYRHYEDTTDDERMMKFNALPTCHRGLEKFLNPEDPSWRFKYYDNLFDINIDSVREKQIATNYLEGLEWTFKYYTTGCPNWRWCYKYHYPPLLSDLMKHIPYFETTYIEFQPFNPVSQIMQLCYVLPKYNLDLLPGKLKEALLNEFPEWYGDNFKFHWAFCKYFWESHAQLPEINLNKLSIFLDKNKHLLPIAV